MMFPSSSPSIIALCSSTRKRLILWCDELARWSSRAAALRPPAYAVPPRICTGIALSHARWAASDAAHPGRAMAARVWRAAVRAHGPSLAAAFDVVAFYADLRLPWRTGSARASPTAFQGRSAAAHFPGSLVPVTLVAAANGLTASCHTVATVPFLLCGYRGRAKRIRVADGIWRRPFSWEIMQK